MAIINCQREVSTVALFDYRIPILERLPKACRLLTASKIGQGWRAHIKKQFGHTVIGIRDKITITIEKLNAAQAKTPFSNASNLKCSIRPCECLKSRLRLAHELI